MKIVCPTLGSRRTAFILLPLLLSACSIAPVSIESVQKPEVPPQWSDPSVTKSQAAVAAQGSTDDGKPLALDVDWWRQFGSAELTALVDEGQRNNFEIAAAVSRVRQAEANARIAGAPLLPEVDAAASGNRAPLVSAGSAATTTSAVLQVNYEIDFWGKNKAGLASAEASLRANLYDRETVALTVTSGIVSTYLQVLSLRDRLDIAQQNVDNAQRVLRLVEAQSRAGAASSLDLARQRAAVAGLQAIIPDLQQQERDAQTALAILLGRPPQYFSVNEKGLDGINMPQIKPGLPSELLTRRPDIRRAEAKLAAANANVAAARAALFPSIRLTGAAGAQSSALLSLFNGSNLLLNLGASITAPIFDAGVLNSQRDLAIAQKQELLDVYRSTVIGALSEVEKSLGAIRSLGERYQLKKQEVDQARYAFDLSEIRYRVGAEDLMTVLDTQRSLSEARNQLGQIKLLRLQATVSLYKALGGGWKDDLLQMLYGGQN